MKNSGCIVGVDAGTSVVKAVGFTLSGDEVGGHEIPLDLISQHPTWVEQDMNQMWEGVRTCLAQVIRNLRAEGRDILGIGITSSGDGTWMIDADGNPVRNGMFWCDGRAGDIVARWYEHEVAAAAFDICGTAVHPGSQASQLAWLQEHEAESLQRAAHILHPKDWLFYKLTGLITSDDTDESLTMLRMSTRAYDLELFRIFGIEDLFPKFPPVKATLDNTGAMLPEVAEFLGVPPGLPVGSGPMDVAACALGSGAIEHGEASTVLGTAGIHQVVMNQPILEPRMVGMTLCHGVPGRWLRMLAAMTATPNLEWFLEQFGPALGVGADKGEEAAYARVERLAAQVPPGSDGVIYHPYLFPGGERAPFVKPSARASFTGLNLTHTINHMLRAVYEGVAFATLDCYRHMPIEIKSVSLSGGGAKSDLWCQLISDCVGKPVQVPEGSQFGSKGAALNLGIALGVYRDAQEAVRKSVRMARFFRPDAGRQKLYQELYEVYRATAEGQMEGWDRRARILKANATP